MAEVLTSDHPIVYDIPSFHLLVLLVFSSISTQKKTLLGSRQMLVDFGPDRIEV